METPRHSRSKVSRSPRPNFLAVLGTAAVVIGLLLLSAPAGAGAGSTAGLPGAHVSPAAPSVGCSPFGFGPATNFAAGSVPESVAVGDFNKDGNSDLAVANFGSFNVSTLLGNGTGGFGSPTNFAVGARLRLSSGGRFQPGRQSRSRCGQRYL